MPESLPIILIAGLNCSARLYAEQIPATLALRSGHGCRSPQGRQLGGDCAADPGRSSAAICARRPVDGRLHRF
jgi:hypothetical protein